MRVWWDTKVVDGCGPMERRSRRFGECCGQTHLLGRPQDRGALVRVRVSHRWARRDMSIFARPDRTSRLGSLGTAGQRRTRPAQGCDSTTR